MSLNKANKQVSLLPDFCNIITYMYNVPSIQDRTGHELQKDCDFSSTSASTSQKTNWELLD